VKTTKFKIALEEVLEPNFDMLLCNTDETEETDANCNFFNANFINPSHVVDHTFDHRGIPFNVVSSIGHGYL